MFFMPNSNKCFIQITQFRQNLRARKAFENLFHIFMTIISTCREFVVDSMLPIIAVKLDRVRLMSFISLKASTSFFF